MSRHLEFTPLAKNPIHIESWCCVKCSSCSVNLCSPENLHTKALFLSLLCKCYSVVPASRGFLGNTCVHTVWCVKNPASLIKLLFGWMLVLGGHLSWGCFPVGHRMQGPEASRTHPSLTPQGANTCIPQNSGLPHDLLAGENTPSLPGLWFHILAWRHQHPAYHPSSLRRMLALSFQWPFRGWGWKVLSRTQGGASKERAEPT